MPAWALSTMALTPVSALYDCDGAALGCRPWHAAGNGGALGVEAVDAIDEPERFYLPRAAQDELQQPWTPDHTWKILDPMLRAAGSRQPARREEPKLGRNTLCPCGSGKKHKRCCGARAT
jgi:hypothetical protein